MNAPDDLAPIDHARARPFVLLTLAVAPLAMAASAAGILLPSTYARESASWATQGIGQDAVNLLVYPLLLALALLAVRGSLRAYLLWLGGMAYSTYSYALYAGYVHFGAWFPIYVALLGLSGWALAGGAAALRPEALRYAFDQRAHPRLPAGTLIACGGIFALLWLSEIARALWTGTLPPSLVEAGLLTNPVYILDLAFVLPAMIATGILLLRRRPHGYAFAAPLLAFGVLMGIAILGMFAALTARAVARPGAAVLFITAAVLVQGAALAAFLRHIRPSREPAPTSIPMLSR